MDWKTVYEQYPVNGHLIWLNNCGTTPAGTHILDAMDRFLQGYARRGTLTRTARYHDVKDRIKAILAPLLNCHSDELALIHHTAEGMNFISHGLDLQTGDEIMLLENEYPSNVYPWLHWKARGVLLKTVPMASSPAGFLENFKNTLTAATRVVSLSAVHWCTGMPLPLEAIGSLCRQQGVDLVVDGAQGVGMRPIDVQACHIAYMAFPTWKWLMGPLGMGVLYVRRDRLEKLRPVFVGTESVVDDEQYLPYKDELKPDADRFTISTANFNDWVYFLAALEMLENIGFPQVRHRLAELSEHLCDGLRGAGCCVLSDEFSQDRSAICVFENPGVSTPEILNRFQAAGVVAAERLGRVRLSPHIYNSFEQLDRVARLAGQKKTQGQ
jgi:selenocysteine lyase/cysteine desulfurase